MSPPGTWFAKTSGGFVCMFFFFFSSPFSTSNAPFPGLLFLFATLVCLCHFVHSKANGASCSGLLKFTLWQAGDILISYGQKNALATDSNTQCYTDTEWWTDEPGDREGDHLNILQHGTKMPSHASCRFLSASLNLAFSYAKGLMSLKVAGYHMDLAWHDIARSPCETPFEWWEEMILCMEREGRQECRTLLTPPSPMPLLSAWVVDNKLELPKEIRAYDRDWTIHYLRSLQDCRSPRHTRGPTRRPPLVITTCYISEHTFAWLDNTKWHIHRWKNTKER